MINCPNCGHISLDGNRFCHYCGKPLNRAKHSAGNSERDIPAGENRRVQARKKHSLLLLLLALLAVSVSILYVVNSKSHTAAQSSAGMTPVSNKPLLLIHRFTSGRSGEAGQNIGDSLALAIGEQLYSSRDIRMPAYFEEHIFFSGAGELSRIDSGSCHRLSGKIIRGEENFTVHARLVNPGGDLDFELIMPVAEESLFFEAADSISRRVEDELTSRNLGGSRLPVQDMTTADWPAWQDYTEGKKYFYSGRWNESRWYFKESVLKDSSFALAYQAMAESAVVCGYPEQAWLLGQKALGWIDRLSHRRRLHLKAETYMKSEKYMAEAEAAYREILEIYPWDERARYFLAVLENGDIDISWGKKGSGQLNLAGLTLSVFSFPQWPEDMCGALKAGQMDNSPAAGLISSFCRIATGQYREALEYAAAGQAVSAAGIFDRTMGDIYLFLGEPDTARVHYEAGLENAEPIEKIWRGFRLGQLALTQGGFREARNQWTRILDAAEKIGLRSWVYRIHCRLARMEISRSRYQSALAYSRQAMNIAARDDAGVWPRQALLWRGLAEAGLRRWSDVDRTLNELEKVCRLDRDPKQMRYYHYLNAVVKAAGNILDQSLNDFQEAAALIPEQGHPLEFENDQAFFLNGWAEALERTGRDEESAAVYDRISRLTTGRLDYGDIWTLSLYQQGRLYDKLEQEETAAEKYRRFLQFWAGADSETWEKDEARRRLNEIEQTR